MLENKSDTIRVGILGTGFAGSAHAAGYQQLDNVKVLAMWSRTKSRAQNLVEKLELSDVRIFDDWESLINKDNVDAISLATPAALRIEPVKKAIKKRNTYSCRKTIQRRDF